MLAAHNLYILNMAHLVRSSTLILLLGFLLNGCATTNKSTTTSESASAHASAPATSAPVDDTSTSATGTKSADTITSADTSKGASTDKSAAANNGKSSPESASGPVFKNGAPTAYPKYRDKKDPWEPVNRKVFTFNESVDDYVFKPVARGYKWIVPDPIEMAVGNVFSNLNDIPVTVNNLLQLKFNNALTSSMRFVVNSTFGLAGLVDVASDIGLEKHDEDFGQTMGYHGIASGPYVVIPFLGPSSARDVGGRVLDIASDPVFIGSFFVAPFIGPVVGGTRATDTRAGLLKSEKTLDEAALDKYEFVRDAYLQRRRSLVYDGNPPKSKEIEED